MGVRKTFFLFCFVFLLSTTLLEAQPVRWIVYYGDQLSEKDLAKINIAVLDPDLINPDFIRPHSFHNKSCKKIAYLSLGEAEEYRSYWPSIKDKNFIVEENPDWKGAHRIDLRSLEWQSLVLNTLIPAIIQKGYDGLFLDTIDTAAYLESLDKKFSGNTEALKNLIQKIHTQYPSLLIFPNNGLDLLNDISGFVNGVFVEDLYTRYDFKKKKSLATPPQDTLHKEKILDQFFEKTQKPVFVILYEKSPYSPLARSAIKKAEQKKYFWYLTTIDLKNLGTTP